MLQFITDIFKRPKWRVYYSKHDTYSRWDTKAWALNYMNCFSDANYIECENGKRIYKNGTTITKSTIQNSGTYTLSIGWLKLRRKCYQCNVTLDEDEHNECSSCRRWDNEN